jgi:hypothetical protein
MGLLEQAVLTSKERLTLPGLDFLAHPEDWSGEEIE